MESDNCCASTSKMNDISAFEKKAENDVNATIENDWHVEAVLGPEYTDPVCTVDALVDVIVDKRHTSRLVQELSRLSPIPSLRHLKRVCPDGRILISLAEEHSRKEKIKEQNCATECQSHSKDISTPSSIRIGHKRSFSKASLSECKPVIDSKKVEVLNTLNLKTLIPTSTAETLICSGETIRPNGDKPSTQNYINTSLLLPDLNAEGLQGQLRRVAVPASPPLTRSQYEEAQQIWSCNFHPVQAIEDALSVDAGLTDKEHGVLQSVMQDCFAAADAAEARCSAAAVELITGQMVALGLDARHTHPLQHSAMRLVDLVARFQGGGVWPIIPGEKLFNETLGICKGNSSQYLCTGLDIVMTHEPCAMCAMALTHARARRVFFSVPNPQVGVLYSCKPLFHTLPGLNHRIRVFHVLVSKLSSSKRKV